MCLHKWLDNLSCIFYDFDGVMTDNKVYLLEDGKEMVCVNRGDGYAINKIREMGIRQVIVSTEKNPVVTRRAEKLKLEVIQAVEDKGCVIKKFCITQGIDIARTAFFGNDLNDLSAFGCVGLKLAPANAEPEILELADWISSKVGSEGVIRDFYREITKTGEKDA